MVHQHFPPLPSSTNSLPVAADVLFQAFPLANITHVAIFVLGMKAKQHMNPIVFDAATTNNLWIAE